ncbi:hypothetical protein [Pseudomonas sp. FME51]|uniref:hypothetical protein n=1 Tax=Pseudomonas sp. FME51 TaxID=2742609 RepID=UPI0018669B19|nr:hypothetical protein [Pseudomonas sp. FME51]
MAKRYSNVQVRKAETEEQAMARTVTSPECLSAAVISMSRDLGTAQMTEMVAELKQQSAAIHDNDMSRAESMLTAQAHTLDGLFAHLSTQALSSTDLAKLERYMKLALKAQAQSRATLQTLGEIKSPKHVAFVGQANIGNQVQVNNSNTTAPGRTRKKQKAPNELLETQHDERLDTRAAGKTGRANPAMATVGKKHRTDQ